MSRVAKKVIAIPSSVNVAISGRNVEVKGPKGTLKHVLYEGVSLNNQDDLLSISVSSDELWSFAGTDRSLIYNMIIGVVDGFQKKLELIGVGYRAQMKGSELNLNLGYSHDINFKVPEGLQIETPSQTTVVISGSDKQKVGQAAAEIRSFRPPEPYKGKGVKYSDEIVRRKEVKKK